MDLVAPSAQLPEWLTDEDLQVYADLYARSGFAAPMQIPYRSLHETKEVDAGTKIGAPALLIMGGKDYIMKFDGMEEYVRGGSVREFVPDLEVEFVPEGTHFVQEQFPERVNTLVVDFLLNHV